MKYNYNLKIMFLCKKCPKRGEKRSEKMCKLLDDKKCCVWGGVIINGDIFSRKFFPVLILS